MQAADVDSTWLPMVNVDSCVRKCRRVTVVVHDYGPGLAILMLAVAISVPLTNQETW